MTIVLLLLCLGFSVALFLLGMKTSKGEEQVQKRVTTLSRNNQEKSQLLRDRALNESFSQRVIFPITQKIFDKTQEIIPLSSKSWVRTKLSQAGYQRPHYFKVFLGSQFLATAVLFSGMLGIMTLFGKAGGVIGIGLSMAAGAIGYVMPMLWLSQQAQKRQKSIQQSLPDFLDLLVICVEAGLGLDIAIHRIATMKSVKTSPYLREELSRYTKDTNFGKARKQALLDMADRTGVDDLSVIINALVQAYEMGTGVTHTLRVQADSLRVKRLQKAEEMANKIPVKMIMPIYMFLFPSIFVSIFGPLGMVIVQSVVPAFSALGK